MARSCTRCGAASDADDPDTLPLGWSTATSARGVVWMCGTCTREHTRDIEAKLDEAWWA